MNVADRASFEFVCEFLRGQRDAKNGVVHQAGNTEAYDRGYAAQMESEAVQSEATRRAGI